MGGGGGGGSGAVLNASAAITRVADTDLRAFDEYILGEHLSGRMDFLRRVNWEAHVHPDVFGERIIVIWRPSPDGARAFIRRAIQRGELRPGD